MIAWPGCTSEPAARVSRFGYFANFLCTMSLVSAKSLTSRPCVANLRTNLRFILVDNNASPAVIVDLIRFSHFRSKLTTATVVVSVLSQLAAYTVVPLVRRERRPVRRCLLKMQSIPPTVRSTAFTVQGCRCSSVHYRGLNLCSPPLLLHAPETRKFADNSRIRCVSARASFVESNAARLSTAIT